MTTKVTTLSEPLAIPITTRQALVGILGFLTFAGIVAGLGRLFMGLQASTMLTDGYPWGLWIGFDFTLIAFSGVGFTMAAVVHILHLKKYQPVLRPALLAGLLGYCAVLALLVLDLGRPDRFYNFILFWNIHSPLFEISWCVLLYTTVLMIEVSPCLLERFKRPGLIGWVARIMTPVTILGVTLSTLHQSTLGTLYLNMPHRLDPLWYTPLLPLLFFVSAIMAGLSLGIIVYKGAVRLQSRPENPEIIKGLGYGLVWITLLYLLLKGGEMALAGEMSALLALDAMSRLLLLELVAGAALPMLLWLIPAVRNTQVAQWGIPSLVLAGILLNRFNATMFAQILPPGTVYSPHILEWLSTLGILAGAGLVWGLGVYFLTMVERKEATGVVD
jgi:Ni/Fe-hydrogenase subunit HybB-like protein